MGISFKSLQGFNFANKSFQNAYEKKPFFIFQGK